MKKVFGYLLILGLSIQANCQEKTNLIEISTDQGKIVLEIYSESAPITSTNFMVYVDAGHFTVASFYRTVTMDNQPDSDIKIEVIQGGLSGSGKRIEIENIPHETSDVTGIKHLDGTISMARSRPGSASSEFFICINDQPSLDYGGMRNPDGQGFCSLWKSN